MSPEEAARPLRADARRNRELILRAARDAFAEEGATVALDEIARRAGVGAGTVHRHFPTKDALFTSIVTDSMLEHARRARELAAGDDPAAGLTVFFGEMVDSGQENRAITAALAGTDCDTWSTELASAGDVVLEALAELLDQAQRTGRIRSDLTAKQVKALLVGVLAASDWLGGDATERRRLADMACAGFRPETEN